MGAIVQGLLNCDQHRGSVTDGFLAYHLESVLLMITLLKNINIVNFPLSDTASILLHQIQTSSILLFRNFNIFFHTNDTQ